MSGREEGDRAFSPAEVVVQVKALACELPRDLGLPFSRLSRADIAQEAMRRGRVAAIRGESRDAALRSDRELFPSPKQLLERNDSEALQVGAGAVGLG